MQEFSPDPFSLTPFPAPARSLYWTTGAKEGWWAIRSGDWKLTAQKEDVGLFDLRNDISEANNLAAQMPEKVAELTRLMDAWLADMAAPIGGEGKRYGLQSAAEGKPKKPKSERKKETK